VGIDAKDLLALVGDDDLLVELHRRRLLGDPRDDASIEVGGLRVEPLWQTATWRGRHVALSSRETQVLYVLVLFRSRGQRWVRTDRLTAKIWHVSDTSTALCLAQVLYRLKSKVPGLVVHKQATPCGSYGLDLGAQEAAA
jgi:DNA-binding response OmpR family regulator